MKKRHVIIIGIAVLTGIALVVAFNFITKKNADWYFIQEVGGIKTGIPLDTEDGIYLPVDCNVSGSDSITLIPRQINSAIVCNKIKSRINGNKIILTVIIGMAQINDGDCLCKAVNIGDLQPGNYEVYYDDDLKERKIGNFRLQDAFQ
jgi:hypothetical protein